MKITILQTAKFEDGAAKFVEGQGVCIGIEFIFKGRMGEGDPKKTFWAETGYDMDGWAKQKSEPLHIKSKSFLPETCVITINEEIFPIKL